ncbi:hydrolase, partial [Staphylococcus aureus]|nr:hydrolase [Staphylococcus aureus]
MNELEFVTKHRRHLHQHPELSLHEFETTAYIKAFLDSLNIKYDCPL